MTNYNELAAFAAVVREGSFTRAAAQLGITPSALSHGLKRLEGKLGLTLLHRSTRSVAPTEAGQRLYASVAPRLEDIRLELAALSESRDEISGRVRINAPDHAVQSVIWPRLSPLLAAHPHLHVELSSEDRFTDIIANRFDIGVRLGRDVAADMIAARIAPDMPMAVAGSPAYFRRHGTPRSPDELERHQCLGFRLPTHANLLAWQFKQRRRTRSLQPNGRLVFNEPATLLAAARDGHGLIWLPRALMQQDLDAGRLVSVLNEHAISYEGYHLYYPARRTSAAMRAVIEAMKPPAG